jgi:short-subunit dehydrogenase
MSSPILAGKNASVTGATRGPGPAIARTMREAEANLLLTVRTGDALTRASNCCANLAGAKSTRASPTFRRRPRRTY